MSKLIQCIVLVLIAAPVAAQTPSASTEKAPEMVSGGQSQLPEVHVYKTPTCGCCGKWVDHMRAHGFSVKTTNMPNLDQVKAMNGVPRHLSSCHTALVDGYVVEGHVPAEDVLRLIEQRPAVSGITVPRMPVGSPGMEGPNPQRYRVLAFDSDAGVTTFAVHGP